MSYLCKDCPGNPDFLSQYNKENHRGQCHANTTRCKDANGTPQELERRATTGLFYCPTCGIGCDVANAIRPHVSKCKEPKGSGEGQTHRMGGFATPTDHRISKTTGTKASSASPSPANSPSFNANGSSSRAAKASATRSSLSLQFATGDDDDEEEEEGQQKEKERAEREKERARKEKDRVELEKKREKARAESRKKDREREEERETERKVPKPKPVQQPSGPRPPSLPSFQRKPAEQQSSVGGSASTASSSRGGSDSTFARAPNAKEPFYPHSSFASGSNSSYPPPPPPHQPKHSSNHPSGSSTTQPRPEAPLPNRPSRLGSIDPLDSFDAPPFVEKPSQAPPAVFAKPVNVSNPPSTTHSTYPSGLPLSNPNRRLPPPAKSSLKKRAVPSPPPSILEPSLATPPVAEPPLPPQPSASSSKPAKPKPKAKPQPQPAPIAGGSYHNAFETAEKMFHSSGLKSQVGNFTLGKTPDEGKKLKIAVHKLLRSLKPKKPEEVRAPVSGPPPAPPPNSAPRPLYSSPGVVLHSATSNVSALPLPLPVASTSNPTLIPLSALPIPARPTPAPVPSSSVAVQLPSPVVAAPASTEASTSSSVLRRPRAEEEEEEQAYLAAEKPVLEKKRAVIDW